MYAPHPVCVGASSVNGGGPCGNVDCFPFASLSVCNIMSFRGPGVGWVGGHWDMLAEHVGVDSGLIGGVGTDPSSASSGGSGLGRGLLAAGTSSCSCSPRQGWRLSPSGSPAPSGRSTP